MCGRPACARGKGIDYELVPVDIFAEGARLVWQATLSAYPAFGMTACLFSQRKAIRRGF